MNICLLNDSFPPVIDGVVNVVMNYADILTRELESKVVVATPKYPDASYDAYPYSVIAYPSFDTTDFIKGYRTGNPLSVREIAQIVDQKPQIIHTHCPAASTIMARILRSQTSAPIVFTYHTKFDVDIARAVGEGFLKKETIKAMVSNIEGCDDVWVVSEGAGENLRSLGYEGELRVMPNGVDFPKGRATQKMVKDVTQGVDVPEGIPVFLFVGRIIQYKGLPMIIDALNELSGEGKEYRMVFVGGGPDEELLQQKIKNYGIALDVYDEKGEVTHFESSGKKSGKMIFTGPVHDREKLRAWNTRADLFLFPSTYDTNGIVVREAAACGLGSVLIKGSCAAEGITDGRNGYLIDENSSALAGLLRTVCMDLDGMHQVGQHAMDEIYISWSNSVRLAFDRYKELLELKADGQLVRRKHQSFESLMRNAEIALDGTQRAFFEMPKQFQMEMKDNLEELRKGLSENISQFGDIVSSNFDKLNDGFTEIRDKINEKFEN
ncbi:MAG: glycosyltransferase [Butyrivibrio sp.]|nr:glycosyltransferase [Butyrivibrio sp.]